MVKQYTLTAAKDGKQPEIDLTPDRFELFYGYCRGIDGHGGPYYDLAEAQTAAAAKLAGCLTMLYVEIRQELPDGFSKLVQKLTKSE